ncbi:MAG: pseudoazurin [Bdellovibrionales bacterium]|jgi:pseudoazurin|nr:pseudoazurin [Bdellovibrionales bacterium]
MKQASKFFSTVLSAACAFVLVGLAVLGGAKEASAATHEVKMLNAGKEGVMVFEPAFLKVNKGDTIKFLPTNPAHDVASVSVPKGAKGWTGKVNEAVTITVTEEGVYVYECKAHIAMAMVGLIQVGKPTNLAEAKTAAAEVAKKFVMNKDRFDKYFAQVK